MCCAGEALIFRSLRSRCGTHYLRIFREKKRWARLIRPFDGSPFEFECRGEFEAYVRARNTTGRYTVKIRNWIRRAVAAVLLLAALGASARGQRVKVWVSSNGELSRMYQLLTTAFPSAPGEEFAAAFRIEISHDW
jgi:hypothetical protein